MEAAVEVFGSKATGQFDLESAPKGSHYLICEIRREQIRKNILKLSTVYGEPSHGSDRGLCYKVDPLEFAFVASHRKQ